jgi:hypothetical protein
MLSTDRDHPDQRLETRMPVADGGGSPKQPRLMQTYGGSIAVQIPSQIVHRISLLFQTQLVLLGVLRERGG